MGFALVCLDDAVASKETGCKGLFCCIMKYIFVVQGEGRGHFTQAMTMNELLKSRGHEVVEILVGKSPLRHIPDFFKEGVSAPIHTFESINFLPSADDKRPNVMMSVLHNTFGFPKYFPSIQFVYDRICASGADVVVNFYEPMTGLAYLSHDIDVPMICIGHQYLFLHKDFNLPREEYPESYGLDLYTRLTAIKAVKHLALSFREMPPDKRHKIVVVPPLLRPEVMAVVPQKGEYIHGYMLNKGFAEDVRKWHAVHPETELHFFWDNWDAEKIMKVDEKLYFHLLDNEAFLKYMAGCKAYASTAGFESVCEAMWMGKPVLMVPSHIEQEINAFDAEMSGIGITCNRFDLSRLLSFADRYNPDPNFRDWASSAHERIAFELENVSILK